MTNFEPSERETKIKDGLRSVIQKTIDEKHLSLEQLADLLGLLPVGAEVLLHREWDFETCFRLAEVVGLEVEVIVKGKRNLFPEGVFVEDI